MSREKSIIETENPQPLFRAFMKEKGLKTGDEYNVADYMFWLDELTQEKRKEIEKQRERGKE